ncbi:hypothetical protein B0T16DRAFT_388395 [Cercophora newfieldiana]|uniref:AAA+ ATPase domain-containing protein n=1 Tax=Cercophora newfieldiana TaxID=92897 RepID=A0AA39YAN5_9PEZI|nr:hypothetical protein B0T16DRAFT_388395 [Cercophora newfieldiana]
MDRSGSEGPIRPQPSQREGHATIDDEGNYPTDGISENREHEDDSDRLNTVDKISLSTAIECDALADQVVQLLSALQPLKQVVSRDWAQRIGSIQAIAEGLQVDRDKTGYRNVFGFLDLTSSILGVRATLWQPVEQLVSGETMENIRHMIVSATELRLSLTRHIDKQQGALLKQSQDRPHSADEYQPPNELRTEQSQKGTLIPQRPLTFARSQTKATLGVRIHSPGGSEQEDDDDDDRSITSGYSDQSSRDYYRYRSASGPTARPSTRAHFGNPFAPGPSQEVNDICQIHRATMEEWKSKLFDHSDFRKRPAVIQAFYHRLHPSLRSSTSAKSPSIGISRAPTFTSISADARNLQRVLIRSQYIHIELEKLFSGAQALTYPISIAPPFKLLVQFLPDIQQRVTDLKKELETLSNSPGVSRPDDTDESNTRGRNRSDQTDEDDKAGEDTSNEELPSPVPRVQHDENSDFKDGKRPPYRIRDSYETRERKHELRETVKQLELLVTFTLEEFKDVLDMRVKIAAATLEEISFQDLWQLFKPGDLILSTRGPNQQLLRVCSVTGGQLQLRNHTIQESEHMDRLREQSMRWRNMYEKGLEDVLREEASGVGVWTPLTIDCYVMGFDGTEIGPLDQCKRIRHYSGKRLIRELDVYPLQFHPECDKILKRMEDRGRRVLGSYGHKRYKGPTINRAGTETQQEIVSDVFIDMKTYFESAAWQTPGLDVLAGGPPPPGYYDNPSNRLDFGHLLKTRPNPTETSENLGHHSIELSGREVDMKMSEDFLAANRVSLQQTKATDPDIPALHLQLMKYPVVGYAFRYRRWCFLDIDLVEDIDLDHESRDSGFNELVIPQRYRDLLVALVDNHVSGSKNIQSELPKVPEAVVQAAADEAKTSNQIDLVKGKGQGVIILLHGSPGSGKTSTAETIAAFAKRPLYHLTFGDIGTHLEIVEMNLVMHTRTANKWGCVLLLDEADVFLRQRDWDNMTHNALVSVFLRELEYYSGILFLTTNRPGVMDEAFKSRIHITLNYPSVGLESTRTMWTNILNRIDRDNATNDVKVVYNRDELLDFAERHYRRYEPEGATWNGRQIRNAFRTALAIGHYDRLSALRDEGMTPAQAAKSGKKKWMRVRLTKRNFQKVAKTSYEFEEYLSGLRGKDSDNVRDAEVRDDLFTALGEAVQMARKDYGAAGKGKKGIEGALSAGGRGGASKGVSGKGKGKAVVVERDEDEDEDEEDDEEDEDED